MKMSQHVENVLRYHLGYMLEHFRGFLQDADLNGSVTSGTGVSESGVVAAFIEYSPRRDPAEDVLDAIIDITLTNHEARYEADVCMSSGEVLAEVASTSIHYRTDQDLLNFIDDQTTQIREELLQRLMAFAKALDTPEESCSASSRL